MAAIDDTIEAVVTALTSKFEKLSNKSGVITDTTQTGDDVKYPTLAAVRTWVNSKLSGKQDTLVGSGTGQNIKTINNESLLGTGNISITVEGGDYSSLNNKPKINNVELDGNKSLSDIGIQGTISDLDDIRDGAELGSTALQSGDNVSELENDAGYLTEHQSLSNYYTKTQVDTSLGGKVDKVTGKGLSTVDFTDTNYVHTDNNFTTALKNQITTNASDIDSLESDVGSLETDVSSLETDVEGVKSKIPSEATSTNKLADKNFVNSSIATATATFRGTFESVAALEAYSGEKDNNDYAFVKVYDTTETSVVKAYKRYKYNETAWVFEYELNNSSFTAEQWATINSGLTSTSLNNYNTKSEITSLLNGKVDKVTGKGLSTVDFTDTNYVHTDNNYTTAEKNKLAGVAYNANNYDDTEVRGLISAKADEEDIQAYFEALADAINDL